MSSFFRFWGNLLYNAMPIFTPLFFAKFVLHVKGCRSDRLQNNGTTMAASATATRHSVISVNVCGRRMTSRTWRNSREYKLYPLINGLSDHDAQYLITDNEEIKVEDNHTYFKRKINKYTIADFQLKLSHETWEQVFNGTDVNEIFSLF